MYYLNLNSQDSLAMTSKIFKLGIAIGSSAFIYLKRRQVKRQIKNQITHQFHKDVISHSLKMKEEDRVKLLTRHGFIKNNIVSHHIIGKDENSVKYVKHVWSDKMNDMTNCHMTALSMYLNVLEFTGKPINTVGIDDKKYDKDSIMFVSTTVMSGKWYWFKQEINHAHIILKLNNKHHRYESSQSEFTQKYQGTYNKEYMQQLNSLVGTSINDKTLTDVSTLTTHLSTMDKLKYMVRYRMTA